MVVFEQNKPDRILFGREDLTRVYDAAKDAIFKYDAYKVYQFQVTAEFKELTIFNFWKIRRYPDDSVKGLRFDIASETWVPIDLAQSKDVGFISALTIFPINNSNDAKFKWRSLVSDMVWYVLRSVGYDDLVEHHNPINVNWDRFDSPKLWEYATAAEKAKFKKKNPGLQLEMAPSRMAYILISQFVGPTAYYNAEHMELGVRGLRACIFNEMLDPAVVKPVLSIDYKYLSFSQYLQYTQCRDSLIKVYQEHPNLMPMLRYIDQKYWGRSDLFSRKLWVKQGRKRTLVDLKPFNSDAAFRIKYSSFEANSTFRTLLKMPHPVIQLWINECRKDPICLEVIGAAIANVNDRIPAIGLKWAMKDIQRRRLHNQSYRVAPVKRLFHVYFVHLSEMWKREGFNVAREFARYNSNRLNQIQDWLFAEGIANGHPTKQDTYASLERLSVQWHVENKQGDQLYAEWETAVPTHTIDDIVFTAIINSKELAKEGYMMHHCIGSYYECCVEGGYQAYSVVEPNGVRSTLGIWVEGKATYDQHRGPCNQTVSPAAAEAGRLFVAYYNQIMIGK